MSLAITRGVRITVRTRYLPEQSAPGRKQYRFAYTIRIANESDFAVQIRSRHWIITDADGHVEEVRGPGVVGQQPTLVPGHGFEYTSGCELATPRGTMAGTYQMVLPTGETFDAEIAPFELALPTTLN